MNREIKFRAWHYDVLKEKYIMKSFESIQNNCGAYFFEPQKYQPNPHILMQYTGLKDKNGVEIYEGDILESDAKTYRFSSRTKHPYYWVGFSKGNFTANGYNGEIKVAPDLNNRSDYSVIGNIYENPELLANG